MSVSPDLCHDEKEFTPFSGHSPDVYLSDLSSNATPDQYADYITLIALDEAHQTLYIATSTGELFSFDLNAQKLTLISEDIPHDLKDLEIGPEGDLYAINDSSLFHIRIPDQLKSNSISQP